MTTRKRIMRKFTIEEISAVDSPAQVNALAVILKRKDATIAKRAQLTSVSEGHTHLIILDTYSSNALSSGHTDYATSGGEYYNGHTHPWILVNEVVIIGEAEGHTHTVEPGISKNQPGVNSMTDSSNDQSKKDLAAAIVNLAEAEKVIAKAKKVMAFTPEEFNCYVALSTDIAKQDEFILKDSGAKKQAMAELKKIAVEKVNSDIIYTATDGTVYYKTDDTRLVSLAKTNDINTKKAVEAKQQVENSILAARAKELPNLTGTPAEIAKMLGAIDAIEDGPIRKSIVDIIVAQNDKQSTMFKSLGHTTDSVLQKDSPEAKLDILANEYAVEKSVSVAAAYTKVLATKEGADLYTAMN